MVFKKNYFSEQVCGTRDPLETPPPFMANAILNFHFDFLTPSLNGLPAYHHKKQEKGGCGREEASQQHFRLSEIEEKKTN